MYFLQRMGDELTSILSTKISSALKRAIMSSTRNNSITRSANSVSIAFPMLAVDTIPRDVVTELAKTVEVKMAMDIKIILERVIADNPKEVDYNGVISQLPFRGLFRDDDGVYSSFKGDVGTSAIRAINYAESINLTAENYAAAYCNTLLEAEGICTLIKADVETVKAKALLAESQSGDVIIRDRTALPTYVKISLKYIKNDMEIKETEHILSVECIPRYVRSKDLKIRMSAYNPSRMFKRFVQLTNKEISFISDFALDMDLLKAQARDAAYKGMDSEIFASIERNHKVRDMGINVYPFLCLLLSKEYVEDMLSTERMDIRKEYKQIMKKFFAMGMFIYNEATDIVEVVYDGHKSIEKYPLDDLARDTSKYEKELKQIVKMYK
ncbi:MAG: hypothetical protein ACRCZ9_12255 [Fusobacteriaceae bacterium]